MELGSIPQKECNGRAVQEKRCSSLTSLQRQEAEQPNWFITPHYKIIMVRRRRRERGSYCKAKSTRLLKEEDAALVVRVLYMSLNYRAFLASHM